MTPFLILARAAIIGWTTLAVFPLEITFNADGSWSYVSDTTLQVRGRAAPFLHRDRNTLVKVAGPKPNPLADIVAGRG